MRNITPCPTLLPILLFSFLARGLPVPTCILLDTKSSFQVIHKHLQLRKYANVRTIIRVVQATHNWNST